MNLNLSGKRALVCGSSQGMGASIAKEFASNGAQVTLFARNEQSLKKVAAELPGQNHDYLVADFNLLDQVKSQALEGLALGDYHILINNSGGPSPGLLHQASLDEFDAMQRHLHVSHTLVQLLLDGMKRANYGRIVNIISTSVRIPIPNLGVSNTIRGAMASWSKTMANELGIFGVTVNNVLPGFINTSRIDDLIVEMSKNTGESETEVKEKMIKTIPIGRFGKPEEIAAYVAFLCSSAGTYINGTSLRIDGGKTGSI